MEGVNWLSKFESIVKARTPGPWHRHVETGLHPFIVSDKVPIIAVSWHENPWADLEFIALSGTVADEVLELIKAAKQRNTFDRALIKCNSCDDDTGFSCSDCLAAKRVTIALAKLAAKINEHK